MKKILLLALLLNVCPGSVFAQSSVAEKVTAVYFGSPYCGHCLHFEREFLPGFMERNKDKMNFVKVDVTQDNLAFMDALREYGAEFPGTPAMAIGNEFLMGYPQEIGTRADLAVTAAIQNGEKTRVQIVSGTEQTPVRQGVNKTSSVWRSVSKKAEDKADIPPDDQPKPSVEQPVSSSKSAEPDAARVSAHENVFKRLTFWMVAGAGLADGINPCAFSVIVFFISFLSVYKYTRREMAAVGISYCVSVFLAYVLLGLGAFKFLYAMQGFYYVMWTLKAATALLCAAFLALSVYDFVHYRRTRDASVLVLQLPAKYKTFIHKVMHAFLKDRQKSVWRLGVAAAAVGFIVSMVEAVCTGQVYLPTIVIVLKEAGGHVWRAVGYLLFYNLMFIVPLAGVFLLALAGYESKTFGGWLKKHLGLTKLLMCLVFFALLAVLIKTW